jgi:surfeit locus 1 family protein
LSRTKLRIFVAFAVFAAAACIRLGFWQLHRLGERRARNALVIARLDSTPVNVRDLPRDSAAARFRRVRITGVPDYEHELVYAARTRRGSPGVNLLTPIRIAGSDTAILLNRGWVYSGDAATVDLAKWRERDSTFEGYVDEFPRTVGSTFTGKPNIIARLSYDVVAKALPYPVAPIYVVMTSDSATAADRVARIGAPPLDEGPHFSYAVQWFGFALVALVGASVVVMQARSSASRTTAFPGPAGDARAPR